MTIAAELRSAMAAGAAVDGDLRNEAASEERCKPASPLKLATLCVAAVLSVTVLTALGVWQIQRLGWKLDLIERVNQRVAAAPVPAPGPASWSRVTAADDAYRHVFVKGRFGENCDTLVRAVTELGGGYWVLAPFRAADGFTILVNRGFVPSEHAGRGACAMFRPRGETVLTGLLRIGEPGGGFLRHNDPAGDRWYSRDVAAIAAARGIEGTAPYFIDAEASPDRAALPVGGLTVIAFPNNHLVYALTWFGLAMMAAGWSLYAVRQEWAVRKRWTGSGDRNS